MPRRDVDQPRRTPLFPAALQIKPFSVNGNTPDARADRAKHHPGSGIPRLLHPHRFSGIQQNARSAIQRFLCAGKNQHLLGRALHSSRSVQVGGDRVAQRTIPESLTPR